MGGGGDTEITKVVPKGYLASSESDMPVMYGFCVYVFSPFDKLKHTITFKDKYNFPTTP